MTKRTRPRPPWADRYLTFDAWNRNEFRQLLCGLPPNPSEDTPWPADVPVPSREEQTDKFMREEPRRVAAERHMCDAVATGQLKILEPVVEELLEKVKSHLSTQEIAALRRAIIHEGVCSERYLVARDEAIRWAASRRKLFPDFPFTADDLQSTLGTLLEKYRRDCGWSIATLASKLEVEESTVKDHLSDRARPHLQTLKKYVAVFNAELQLPNALKITDFS